MFDTPPDHALLGEIRKLTDIAVRCDKLDESLMFPGPLKLSAHLFDYANQLSLRFKSINAEDATLDVFGIFWRGHLDRNVVDGEWIRFRRMPETPPQLDTLPTRLPSNIESALTSGELSGGGIVLVVGGTGCGKTFTASATVRSRLLKFGGMAYTVEEPPEHPLNGWHDKGYCAQTWVKDNGPEPWADALKGVLRSQPAATPTLLFLGEVREAAAACVAVRASGNGFLVLATAHASDIASGLAMFSEKLTPDLKETFANQFKLAVYQRLSDGLLEVNSLKASLAVTQIIMRGAFHEVGGEMELQRNQIASAGVRRPQYNYS